jgi:hypothetical protein
LISPFVVLMRDASARKVTVSLIAAGGKSKSTTRVALSVMSMRSRTIVLNPGSAAATSYGPSARNGRM